jgi:hypothetical protein
MRTTVPVFVCLLLIGGALAAMQGRATTSAADVLASVVPDLASRVGQFKKVRMPFDAARLSARERQLVTELVTACQWLERSYSRKSDPQALAIYKAIQHDASPRADNLRRYLIINGSRFDLVDENRPFVGSTPMPPGHALYPPDLTKSEIEAYVAAHPEKKAALYSPFTVVRRQGGDLVARPYHEEFREFVVPAAASLRRAAALSDDAAFAKFLQLRAEALLTDDYYESDLAWLDLKDPKFDIVFAPYETYLDDLLGVKTSYGAAVLLRDESESRKLALFQRWVPELQDALPLAAADRPSVRGHVTPMEVMDAPYRGGDLRHGYQAVADNLPNDPRIHQEKGTKKIVFKNFMDALVREVILPLPARLMDPAQARQASADGQLTWVIMHEISHGLGPAFARRDGRTIDIREAMGGLFSGLEEAKADVVGIHGLKWLVDKGVLPAARLEEYYASYVSSIFRTIRFGTGEAHGRAEMMEFNYLSERGAITHLAGRYRIEYAKMAPALADLAKELLEQEATGDRDRAAAWFAKYDRMPADLATALAAARDVPIDVDPMFSFPDPVE